MQSPHFATKLQVYSSEDPLNGFDTEIIEVGIYVSDMKVARFIISEPYRITLDQCKDIVSKNDITFHYRDSYIDVLIEKNIRWVTLTATEINNNHKLSFCFSPHQINDLFNDLLKWKEQESSQCDM